MIAAILGALLSSLSQANAAANEPGQSAASSIEEQVAAQRHVANLRSLLATRIVLGVQRGIMTIATSRPRTLTVEVTDDPSPYAIAAQTKTDGDMTVRLSIGYTTLHDAALDAVALSAGLRRPPHELHDYLQYQWLLARENQESRRRGQPTRRMGTFAEFVGLEANLANAVIGRARFGVIRTQVRE